MGNERKGYRRYRAFEQRRRLEGAGHGSSRPSRVNLSPSVKIPIVTSEAAIERFCGGCDHLSQAKKTCEIADYNNQARYVDGRWCGWASVGGARGEMTARGFQKVPSPTNPQTTNKA